MQLLSFDGVDDLVDCGNEATLWSASLTKFSMSFWMYPTINGGLAVYRTIVNHGWITNNAFLVALDAGTPNRVDFYIDSAAGVVENAYVDGMVLNSWNHITAVYDNSLGSANIKIYRNGVLGAGTIDMVTTLNLSASLGLVSDSGNDRFGGYLRDFRWWTTKPLTQAEILQVMINDPTAPTPNYWLKMNEGTGNPVDAIGGSLVGTLTGGLGWRLFSSGSFGKEDFQSVYSLSKKFSR